MSNDSPLYVIAMNTRVKRPTGDPNLVYMLVVLSRGLQSKSWILVAKVEWLGK